jgi:hypothetical protein
VEAAVRCSEGRGVATRWLAASFFVLAVVALGATLMFRELGSGGAAGSATSVDLSGLPKMSAETRSAYEAAPSHQVLYGHLPCYCGCALLKQPHASLRDCFLKPDGSFEAHASGCKICTDIATDALAMEKNGADHTAIRAAIDAKYVRAGPATKTALP